MAYYKQNMPITVEELKTKLFKTHPTGYTSNLPERFLTTVELRELYNETFH